MNPRLIKYVLSKRVGGSNFELRAKCYFCNVVLFKFCQISSIKKKLYNMLNWCEVDITIIISNTMRHDHVEYEIATLYSHHIIHTTYNISLHTFKVKAKVAVFTSLVLTPLVSFKYIFYATINSRIFEENQSTHLNNCFESLFQIETSSL